MSPDTNSFLLGVLASLVAAAVWAILVCFTRRIKDWGNTGENDLENPPGLAPAGILVDKKDADQLQDYVQRGEYARQKASFPKVEKDRYYPLLILVVIPGVVILLFYFLSSALFQAAQDSGTSQFRLMLLFIVVFLSAITMRLWETLSILLKWPKYYVLGRTNEQPPLIRNNVPAAVRVLRCSEPKDRILTIQFEEFSDSGNLTFLAMAHTKASFKNQKRSFLFPGAIGAARFTEWGDISHRELVEFVPSSETTKIKSLSEPLISM